MLLSPFFTSGAVFFVLLLLILRGYPPLLVTITVSSAVTCITLILIGGFNVKTLAAIVGTIGGVSAAGGLVLL
ncbi:MAG TPA: hypothetical protein ENM97_06025 [Moorella mulderi]|nr:hypothetical protein [Moorella mulderi]